MKNSAQSPRDSRKGSTYVIASEAKQSSGNVFYSLMIVIFVLPFTSVLASTDDEMMKGFSSSTGISEAEKLGTEDERLKIGGTFWTELDYYGLSTSENKQWLFNPNNLWVYGDARLRNNVRAFVKGRLIYDPVISGNAVSPLTGLTIRQFESSLDEAKLMFNAGRLVYFTVGRQKIKWGSGKFWNPTDFLNTSRREMFRSEDYRSGLTLLKTHVPIGRANLILIQDLEGASKPSLVGHAARAELALSSSEIALSAFSKTGRKAVIGLDVSFAVWDFDLYAESAYTKDVFKTVVGVSYDYKVSDSDTISFGLEYFYNGDGYTNTDLYLGAVAGGTYIPYYLSQHYGMFMIWLPSPGRLDDFTFTLFNLVNLTDHSAVSRLNVDIKLLQDIKCNLAFGVHYGNANGELRLGGQSVDLQGGLRVEF
ncbi:MAG: hypothetical protein HY537_02140 [Deltaproteobacteria bacterium]|nr:hypothetical protein [Deltaproteobacteria bacterium]